MINYWKNWTTFNSNFQQLVPLLKKVLRIISPNVKLLKFPSLGLGTFNRFSVFPAKIPQPTVAEVSVIHDHVLKEREMGQLVP